MCACIYIVLHMYKCICVDGFVYIVVVSCLDKRLPHIFSNTVYYNEHLNSTENPTSKKKTIQTVDCCGLQTSHLRHHHTQLGWADFHCTNTLPNVDVKQGETLTK